MTLPKQESFTRACYPDPVEAFGYPFGAVIVAKVKKEWGLFHRESGLLIFWYDTRAEACAMAQKCGHWPSWGKIKRNDKYPPGLTKRIGGALRAHGIIPPLQP